MGHVARVGYEINAWSLYSFFWAMKMEQRIPKHRHIKFRPPKRNNTAFRTQRKFEIRKIRGSCGKEWRRENVCQTKRRWEMCLNSVDWIRLTNVTDKWRVLVGMTVNFLVLQNARNLLINWRTLKITLQMHCTINVAARVGNSFYCFFLW